MTPARRVQTYANHKRYFPLYHYVALPIFLANVVVAVSHAIQRPTPFNTWLVVLSIGLVAALLASRASTLHVQNRLIALEMRLRLATTLAPELRSRRAGRPVPGRVPPPALRRRARRDVPVSRRLPAE